MTDVRSDEVGAHVSSAGGVQNAPARAADIGATVLQLFTKQPNRWAERDIDAATAAAFREARARHGIRVAVSHDSYLINLATPDATLLGKSYASFRAELQRCAALGIEFLVTHPGNATDGDAERGLRANADALSRALIDVPGETIVLLETTAGSGSVLGASFEQLAALRGLVVSRVRRRVGYCLDTCHVWSAGYDLRGDYDAVVRQFDEVAGLEHLRLFHLNDSQYPRASRRDRHAAIAEGTLGPEPFRRIITDPRLRDLPKILETPKGDDVVASDRRNLARLRSYRSSEQSGAPVAATVPFTTGA